MLEMERHILRLLLDNDCVIVPNFGGFVAHRVKAYYDEEEKAYFPPTRSIGFNPRLAMNDSLLAQSYVDAYDISYPEALKRIGEKVESIKQTVEAEGEYCFSGIGFITKASDSTIDFQPCTVPVLTPSCYGFSPILIDTLKQEEEAVEPSTAYDEPQDETTPRNAILKIAAAVIVFILFALFPSPAGNSSKSAQVKSAVDTNILYRMMPKDITKGKPENLANGVAPKEKKAVARQEQQKAAPRTEKCYSIVLASRVSKANAEAYVKQLHRKGMTEAQLYKHGKDLKVIYRHFATKEAAVKALNLLNDDAQFSGCWVSEVEPTDS
jgi:hypothetical protein